MVNAGTDPLALSLESDGSQLDVRGCRVLIVDDNAQNLELVQAYLESLPLEILSAADGMAAMAAVDAFKPDLILLDVMSGGRGIAEAPTQGARGVFLRDCRQPH